MSNFFFFIFRYELVDSSELWKEVQRKQAERVVQKAKVVASRKIQSELKYNEEKDKENGFHTRSRRHRKHRLVIIYSKFFLLL